MQLQLQAAVSTRIIRVGKRGGLWGGGYVQIAYILQRDCPSFPIRIPDGEESTRPQVQFDVSMLSATRLDLNDVTVPFTFTDIMVVGVGEGVTLLFDHLIHHVLHNLLANVRGKRLPVPPSHGRGQSNPVVNTIRGTKQDSRQK